MPAAVTNPPAAAKLYSTISRQQNAVKSALPWSMKSNLLLAVAVMVLILLR